MDENEQQLFDESLKAIKEAILSAIESGGGSVSTTNITRSIENGTVNLIQNIFNKKEYPSFKTHFTDKIIIPLFSVLKKKLNNLDQNIVLDIDEDIKKIFHIKKNDISLLQEEVKDVLSNVINSKILKGKITDGLSDNLKFKETEINFNNIDTKAFSNVFKFSKNRINQLQDEFSTSLKNDVLPVFLKQFGTTISNKIKNIKFPENLEDLLGKPSKTFNSNEIIKNLTSEISKKKVIFGDNSSNKINISSLLGFDKKLVAINNFQYQRLMFSLLSKIKSGLNTLSFKATDKDGNPIKGNTLTLDISNLLNLPPQLSLFNKLRYDSLIKKLFSTLKTNLDNIKFYSTDENGKRILSDTLTIDLSYLFQTENTVSSLMEKQYKGLISFFVKKLKKQLDDIKILPKEINLNNMVGGSKFNIESTKKSTPVEKEKTGVLNRTLLKITDYFEKQQAQQEEQNVFEKKPEFILSDIGDDALKKINKIFGKEEEKLIKAEKPKDSWLKNINLPTWFKTLGGIGAALATGGIGLLFKGLLDSGPLKGMEKFLGRGLIAGGRQLIKYAGKHLSGIFEKMFSSIIKVGGGVVLKEGSEFATKGMGKGLFKKIATTLSTKLGKSALMKIPGLGAIIGLGFGISRMIKGDIIGGLLDVSSGLVSIVPGIGTAISLAIDAYSMVRDIKGGGSEKLGKSNANLKIQDFVDKVLIKIPFVDSLIRISKAFGSFSTGDWKQGLKELAFIFPGTGILVDAMKWTSKKLDIKKMFTSSDNEPILNQSNKVISNRGGLFSKKQKESTNKPIKEKSVKDYKAFINPKGESIKFDPKDFIKIEASKQPSSFSSKDYVELKKLFTEIRDILKQSGAGILNVDNKIGELNKTSKTGFKDIKAKPPSIFPPSTPGMASPVQLSGAANLFRNNLNPAY